MTARNGKNRKRPERRGAVQVILTVLIVCLAVSFTAVGLYAVAEIRRSSTPYRYGYDEGDYRYSLREERYGDLLYTADSDAVLGTVYSSDVAEYRAVAKYCEAALLWKTYHDAGETAEAERQKERMDRFADEAGDLREEIDKINEKLGIPG